MSTRVKLWGVFLVLAVGLACAKADILSPTGTGTTLFAAPAIDAPGDDEQLSTLRPTLTVRNGSTSRTGAHTYEFQVSTTTTFTALAATKSGVAEGTGGKTSVTLDIDLQIATRYYWRARLVHDAGTSEWSGTARFRSKTLSYNRPGELYDPLVGGDTVGTAGGSTTFVADKGLRINDGNSYLRYALPQTMASGEFSMEVEGLYGNGPSQKMKVFSMFDGTGNLTGSRYELSAQYRGLNGNPTNAIAFKAVWGNVNVSLEPDLAKRGASTMFLNPAQTYFWQGIWTATSFRLVIRDGGLNGSVIYDYTLNAPGGTGPYAPSPHYAYLGATSGPFGIDTGSWPGVTYRNVWLSDKPRPASLGSALGPER